MNFVFSQCTELTVGNKPCLANCGKNPNANICPMDVPKTQIILATPLLHWKMLKQQTNICCLCDPYQIWNNVRFKIIVGNQCACKCSQCKLNIIRFWTFWGISYLKHLSRGQKNNEVDVCCRLQLNYCTALLPPKYFL